MRYTLLISFFILSTVCLKSEVPEPIVSDPDGTIGGHDYVDLGLPSGTLWATTNVGGSSYIQTGYYFAWGELTNRYVFTRDDYEYYVGQGSTPYDCWDILEDIGDNICGTEYDAATHYWGYGWRMPTVSEIRELLEYCEYNWAGIQSCFSYGMNLFGPNGKSIFLEVPGFGFYMGESSNHEEYFLAQYWSGESATAYIDSIDYLIKPGPNAYVIEGTDEKFHIIDNFPKYQGGLIRPVINPDYNGFKPIRQDEPVNLSYRNGTIVIDGMKSLYNVRIFTSSGTLIFEESVFTGEEKLLPLKPGFYIAQMSDNNIAVSNQKIIIR
ncbi:MAG: T9SS type A sorting domain-containing protein [Duncaniella sp.]|nr:T9SS type A sorting domain-containing protein [Duncaniella sp.]